MRGSAKAMAVMAVMAALAAAPAAAATLTEWDAGDFSNDWRSFTVVGNGFTTVAGTGSQNDADHFVLTGLAPGAQTLTFTFSGGAGKGHSFAAGTVVQFAFAPFRWSAWEGKTAGTAALNSRRLTDTVTLTLDQGFAGPLYLALYHTHGALDWSLDVPGNAALAPLPPPPATVPVPAAGLMLAAALGGLGLMRRRRR